MTNRVKVFQIMWALVFLIASGCAEFNIENPENNEVLLEPQDILITYTNVDTTSIVIELNGQDVTSIFTIEPERAQATADVVEPFLIAGQNVLIVEGEEIVPTADDPEGVAVRRFFYDIEGPSVHVLSTTPTANNNITISGYVDDPSGVQSLSLNGTPVDLTDDDEYTVTLADDAFITFEAEDLIGFSTTVTYAPPTHRMDPGATAQVNIGDFPDLEEMLANFVDNADINQIILNNNDPFSQVCVDLFKTLAEAGVISDFLPFLPELIFFDIELCVDVFAESVEIGRPDISLAVPMPNSIVLATELGLRDLIFEGYLQADIPLPSLLDLQLTLETSLLDITSDAALDLEDSGFINATFENIESELEDIEYDVRILPSFVERLLEPVVVSIVEDEVVPDVLDRHGSEILTEIIASTPISVFIPFNEESVELNLRQINLITTQDGFSVDLSTVSRPADERVNNSLGSRIVELDNPIYNPISTQSGANYNTGVYVSVNTVNSLLNGLFEAGSLDELILFFDLEEVTGLDLSELDISTDARAIVSANSAPFLRFVNDEEGIAHVYVQDVFLDVQGRDNEEEPYETILSFTADVDLTVGLEITENNGLTVTPAEWARIEVQTLDTPEGLESLSIDNVNDLAYLALPNIIPLVNELIGEIPFPPFLGFALQVEELWIPENNDNTYLGITGDLTPLVEDTTAAETQ